MIHDSGNLRTDPTTAGAVLESVFERTPGIARQGFFEFLAASIQHLSVSCADRWGVTLFGWGVRLNAGWTECLILSADGVRVLVEESSAPASARLGERRYGSAPGCRFSILALSEIPRNLPSFGESHYAALSIAARRPTNRSIKSGHSDGVIVFLSQALRRPVPYPSYSNAVGNGMLMGNGGPHFELYSEGGRLTALVNRFERDPHAREQCVAHYGARCSVCDMAFHERYGETMADLIHVHHLVPLSRIGTQYQVNPLTDLRPVCPNCHAVIHRGDPPLTIEEARVLLSR
jgi:5-methylcytosine-specific restriction protein A